MELFSAASQLKVAKRNLQPQTYRWYLEVGDGISPVDFPDILKQFCRADAVDHYTKKKYSHLMIITSLTPTAQEGVFRIKASNKAISILQQQPFVQKIWPDHGQFNWYRASYAPSVTVGDVVALLNRLQSVIEEAMLERDILKVIQGDDSIDVYCTARGKNFLSNQSSMFKGIELEKGRATNE